jgi:molybdate transport system permease protein
VLARHEFRGRSVVETLAALPLYCPPTAIGFLLLALLRRDGPLGADTLGFDPGLLLTWRGAVLASACMSFPLVARTARVAFETCRGWRAWRRRWAPHAGRLRGV